MNVQRSNDDAEWRIGWMAHVPLQWINDLEESHPCLREPRANALVRLSKLWYSHEFDENDMGKILLNVVEDAVGAGYFSSTFYPSHVEYSWSGISRVHLYS